MAVLAVPSKGTIVQYQSTASPQAFTTITHQGSITGLGLTVKVEDVTSQDSGSPWRDFVPTLLDPGAISFDMFFQPALAAHKAVLALFTGRGLTTPGEPIPFKLTFSDQALTIWLFSGFITDFKQTATVDGVLKAAVTIRATGQPTFPA